jgi:hypothetical protein
MAISAIVKGSAVALTAASLVAATGPVGAATLTLTNPPTQSDTPETVVFRATGAESIVAVAGYQVNDIEKVTNNRVTLSSGGPNLLGSTWRARFAALGSDAYTFDDRSSVPALAFAAQNPLYMDTFWQEFATTPGDTYTYSFGYWNNTTRKGATPSALVVTFAAVPEPSTWAMLLLGFAGLVFAGRRARPGPIAVAR